MNTVANNVLSLFLSEMPVSGSEATLCTSLYLLNLVSFINSISLLYFAFYRIQLYVQMFLRFWQRHFIWCWRFTGVNVLLNSISAGNSVLLIKICPSFVIVILL